MANLAQNQNQTFQTPMLGQLTMDPQPGTIPAQIDPASTFTTGCAGCAVKLVTKVGPGVVVDFTTSSSDGPVYGIIPYRLKKNTYAAGDFCQVAPRGSVLMLKSSAAIVRGTNVAVTNPLAATNDPLVTTTTTVGDYVAGVALGQAGAANILLKVQVAPGLVQASTEASVGVTP